MRWAQILTILSVLIIISLMFFYLMPSGKLNFHGQGNYNFSMGNNSEMQFYPNMRFPDSNISFQILNCPLQKENEMENAFQIMENITSLKFYSVNSNEEILITCESRNRIENGLFIAGEGGPTNVISAGDFNVITSGEILLIRNSDCPTPNVAIHELLHVLGFRHSENPYNIMYNVTSCDQTIGDDTINLINELYSFPNYPDLTFENASATLSGRFLNINMTIFNAGLDSAKISKVGVYADNNLIKEIDLPSLDIGEGVSISASNIWVSQLNVKEINLIIETDFSEITKENNKIKLKINS